MKTIKHFVFVVVLFCFLFSCKKNEDLKSWVRWTIPHSVETLDPVLVKDPVSARGVHRVYETLFRYDVEKRPVVLMPMLAQSAPEIHDQVKYSFKIKSQVFFRDHSCFASGKGRELKASDVVFSLKRIADPLYASEGWKFFDGKILGLQQWRDELTKVGDSSSKRKEVYAAPISGVKATGPYSFEITLNKPFSDFLHLLSLTYTAVVPEECVWKYGDSFGDQSIGTGAYVLERKTKNDLLWKRNDEEGMVESIVEDSTQRWKNFLQQENDVFWDVPVTVFPRILNSELRTSKEIRDRGIEVQLEEGTASHYIGFNFSSKFLRENVLVRQAMASALDLGPVIEKVFWKAAKRARFLDGMQGGSNTAIDEFSLVKARKILADAGFSDGIGIAKLSLLCGDSEYEKKFAEYFRLSMQQLGIGIQILSSDKKVKKKDFTKSREHGDFDLFCGKFEPEMGILSEELSMFHSGRTKSWNTTGFSDPQVDRWIEEYESAADVKQRAVYLKKIYQVVSDQVPVLWSARPMRMNVAHRWVKRFTFSPFEPKFEVDLLIDAELRKLELSK